MLVLIWTRVPCGNTDAMKKGKERGEGRKQAEPGSDGGKLFEGGHILEGD